MSGSSEKRPSRLRSLALTRRNRPGPLVWLAFAAVLYFPAAGIVLPGLARPFAEQQLSHALDASCTIGALTFNPLTLKLTASDVIVPYPATAEGPGAPFVKLDRVEAILALESVAAKALVLKELSLVRPEIAVSRYADGALSTQRLLPDNDEDGKEDRDGNGDDLFPLVIRNLAMHGGRLTITDVVNDTTHVLEDITMSVPFASTLFADRDVGLTPALSFSVNGRTVEATGESRPFAASRSTEFTLRARNLGLAEFRKYIAPYTALGLESGSVQTELTLRFSLDPEKVLDISLAGTAEVADMVMSGPEGEAIRCKRAFLDLENAVLGPRRVIVNEAVLENPEIRIHRRKDGSVDWTDFFIVPEEALPKDVRITTASGETIPGPQQEPPYTAAPDEAAASGPQTAIPLHLVVRKASVTGGKATWRDSGPKKPVHLTLENIEASFTDVSSENEGRADFTVTFSAGSTTAEVRGKATASPPAMEAAVSLKEFPLAGISGYIPDTAGLILGQGTVSLAGNVSMIAGNRPAIHFTDGALAIAGVRVRSATGEDTPLLDLTRLEASRLAMDTETQVVRAGLVTGTGIAVNLVRGKDGALLLPQTSPADASARQTQAGPPPRPWRVAVDEVRVEKSRFSLADLALRETAVLPFTDVTVSGGNFATHDVKQWNLTATGKPGARGSLSLTAKGSLTPLDLSFSGTMEKADMRSLAPYLREKTQLDLTEATLGGDFTGSVAVVTGSERGGRFAVKGNVGLYGITLLHKRREFFSLGRLRFENIEYAVPESGGRRLAIDSVTCNAPRMTVVIDKKGVSTIQKALAAPGVDAGMEPERAAIVPESEAARRKPGISDAFAALNIGSLTLSQGLATYRDRRVDPPYELKVNGVTLKAANLSLEPAKALSFNGRLTINGSPVTLAGSASSLFMEPSGEASVAVRALDLSRFTQYSAKYLGYPVKSGELSADITASLAGRRLDMENSVIIKGFDLGDKVDSPDAADLPLSAAVSILSDRDGNISLEVPVSGSVGDPAFKLGGVVGQVIGTVIYKTVTSPVRILDKLFTGLASLLSGGGPEDAEIIFPIGETTLDATATAELAKLGAELEKTRTVIVEITGYADKDERDLVLDGLITGALKRMKYADLPPERKANTTPDAVAVGPDRNAREYAELLTRFYKSMRFVRESKDPAITNPQSTRAILRVLRTRMEVTDEHLKALADRRARAVYRALSRGKLDAAARLRILPGVVLESGDSRIGSMARIEVGKR